jgi:hypothetical protein
MLYQDVAVIQDIKIVFFEKNVSSEKYGKYSRILS